MNALSRVVYKTTLHVHALKTTNNKINNNNHSTNIYYITTKTIGFNRVLSLSNKTFIACCVILHNIHINNPYFSITFTVRWLVRKHCNSIRMNLIFELKKTQLYPFKVDAFFLKSISYVEFFYNNITPQTGCCNYVCTYMSAYESPFLILF